MICCSMLNDRCFRCFTGRVFPPLMASCYWIIDPLCNGYWIIDPLCSGDGFSLACLNRQVGEITWFVELMTLQLWLLRCHSIAGVFLFQLDPSIQLTGWYLHGLGLLLQFVILRGRSFGCHWCFIGASHIFGLHFRYLGMMG